MARIRRSLESSSTSRRYYVIAIVLLALLHVLMYTPSGVQWSRAVAGGLVTYETPTNEAKMTTPEPPGNDGNAELDQAADMEDADETAERRTNESPEVQLGGHEASVDSDEQEGDTPKINQASNDDVAETSETPEGTTNEPAEVEDGDDGSDLDEGDGDTPKTNQTETDDVAETTETPEGKPNEPAEVQDGDDGSDSDEGDGDIPKIKKTETDDVAETSETLEGTTNEPAEVEDGDDESSVDSDEREGDTPKTNQTETDDVAETTETPEGKPNEPAEVQDGDDGSDSDEGDGDTPKTNQTETDDVAETSEGNVSNPDARPTEIWENLWRQNIQVDPNPKKLSGKERNWLLYVYRESIKNGTKAKELKTLTKVAEEFPVPKRNDSIAFYSEDTRNRLISRLLLSQSTDRKFKIVATGGSTTAGGGNPTMATGDRYFARFTDFLKTLLSVDQTRIEYVDQGHGTRNSLHTAVLYDQFIPSDTDLLIWEFSTNDAADPQLQNKTKILDTSKQSFLAWINQVSNMEQPPFVMLVYYWDAPFRVDGRGKGKIGTIKANSFESHGDIARQFDFVVGHVNIAAYAHELGLPSCQSRNCIFLSDKHHPSKVGHVATAFLLLNLLSPDGNFESSTSNRTMPSNATNHEWTCGVETEAKRVLKSVITNSSNGWKSPVGSWTIELPVLNQSSSPKALVPAHSFDRIDDIKKAAPRRQDVWRVTPLGSCSSDENVFSLKAPSKPMENVRVMFLSFYYNLPVLKTQDISIQINGSNSTARGELVPMFVFKRRSVLQDWPCHFACTCAWGLNFDLYWFVFDSVQPAVQSVRLCKPPGKSLPLRVQTVAFW